MKNLRQQRLGSILEKVKARKKERKKGRAVLRGVEIKVC